MNADKDGSVGTVGSFGKLRVANVAVAGRATLRVRSKTSNWGTAVSRLRRDDHEAAKTSMKQKRSQLEFQLILMTEERGSQVRMSGSNTG